MKLMLRPSDAATVHAYNLDASKVIVAARYGSSKEFVAFYSPAAAAAATPGGY
jgi:N-methylhydantoinase B/oxoprolinase/acetone carboxylase alpha subunit